MGLFDFFVKKKKIELPLEFSEFPVFDGFVKKGPIKKDTNTYSRITYFTNNIAGYESKILNSGFMKMSNVKYQSVVNNSYIILEKVNSKYKIAYHKVLN